MAGIDIPVLARSLPRCEDLAGASFSHTEYVVQFCEVLAVYILCMNDTVAVGKSITIMRYNKPVADLVPIALAVKFAPELESPPIIDVNWAAPMSDEEADAFVEGRLRRCAG
jgi:antitoxin (DNA-binding transcriptional repressor) of toxin-antitoxin stability system